jgi:AraC family transcriptional regulator
MKGESTMAKSQNRIDEELASQLEPLRFENGKPLLIAGLRGHFTTATWADIPTQWQRLGSFGRVPGMVGPVHYGLCFNMSDGIEYLSGVEVSSVAGLPSEFSYVNIPAQKYVVFAHREHVSKLRNTLDAIWHEWFPTSGHEFARPAAGAPDFFERYGEHFDPRTGMGDVEVWIPIKS